MPYDNPGPKPKIGIALIARRPSSGAMDSSSSDDKTSPDEISQGKLDACDAIIKACMARDPKALCAALDTMHSLQHAEWGDDSYAGGTSGGGDTEAA